MRGQEAKQTCAGCVHYVPKVDMGWTHADVTDLCGLTRTREPRPGIKGCVPRKRKI